MKYSLLIACIVILSQCTNKITPTNLTNCTCPKIYRPVCGEDGIEYDNDCLAECAGIKYEEGTCPITTKGKILFLGDPAIDGCGWVISIEEG